MKVLAFAASNSKTSINKRLVTYAVSLLADAETEVLDLNDYEMPLFSVDVEQEVGSPDKAQQLFAKIGEADAVVVSFAEHNGSYSAAYKNLFDWTSRINQKVFQGKKMVLLSTSPGPGGAKHVLATATTSIPHFNGDVKATLSVPSFYDNFDVEAGKLRNESLDTKLVEAMASLR
ncbi:NADPH-dependent FMN reductase [Grimontia sp. NTOU-MAR1]|uniref:NADPH-dependent FMN reductase n=1 Tax=Grimontia sp. NTOU-MAR1 TaxID=3111011 RepID=UPI002DBD9E61|nr:NAD(P)H-dependent oxidoreductase [Grimontia sp. NTOU-MAR1]WRV99628.1 NAD(P)H-dependent oxidoreductase [Grimontia sp. NTOU-MAR1]